MCGVAAGPLFVTTFTVVGRRQHGYRPRRDPVSTLVLGDHGWVQVANFLAAGVLTCASSVGMRRMLRPGGGAAVPALVGAVGLGLVGAGVFPTDPAGGDLSPDAHRMTRSGALHVACAVPVFLGLPAACLVGARGFRSEGRTVWTAYSVGSGVVALAAATLAGSGFSGERRLSERGGSCQRVALVTGLGWLALYSARLIGRDSRVP
jgi:hypothetical protein